MALTTTALTAAQPANVEPGSWAYEAVKDLAGKGLVLGYSDAKFLDNKSLTRYEMATIVLRILSQVKNAKVESNPAALPAPGDDSPSVSPTQGTMTIKSGDVDTVKKLVDEFKVELAVIGADMSEANTTLESFQTDITNLKDIVNDPEGVVQTTISDVSKLKKIKFSGYVQARYEYDQSTASTFNASGASNNKNGFFVRRARIKLAANPTKQTLIVIQPDFTQSVTTKDAFVSYTFGDDPLIAPTVSLGQYLWPFGFEVMQSTSVRETPEPALVVQKLFPGDYDQGLKFSSKASGRFTWDAAIMNGTGANTKDNNSQKDILARLRYSVAPQLDLGVSGYKGRQTVPPATLPGPGVSGAKDRWGGDFQYYLSNASIKGEWIWGKDFEVDSSGGYLQLAANIGANDVGVVKYDVFDPNTDVSDDNLTRWHLGWIHYLDNQTRFKLFYEFNDEHPKKANNVLRAEIISVF
jgi:hypothetical protein